MLIYVNIKTLIIEIYYFLRLIAIAKYFTKDFKSPFIYIDSLIIEIKIFFKFIKLSYKILTKFKFKILNNILSVACRVAFCKSPKPAFVALSLFLSLFLLFLDASF